MLQRERAYYDLYDNVRDRILRIAPRERRCKKCNHADSVYQSRIKDYPDYFLQSIRI